MSIFKKITTALFPSIEMDTKIYTIYARCNRCQEILSARVNLNNDLSLTDDGGYISRKILIGSNRCFQQIEVILHFDTNRNVTKRDISGGSFITAEEFQTKG